MHRWQVARHERGLPPSRSVLDRTSRAWPHTSVLNQLAQHNLGHDLGQLAAGLRRALVYSEGFLQTLSTAISRDQPPMAAKIRQNLSKINFQRRHSGVQKHHLGVNNDSWKQQAHSWCQNREFRKSEKSSKLSAMKHDLGITRALSNQNLRN